MNKQIFLIIFLIVLVAGCQETIVKEPDIITPLQPIETQPTPVPIKSVLKTEPIDLSGIKTEKIELTKFYKLDPIEIELKVPEYNLPLQASQIKNYDDFNNKINLDVGNELLSKNGFVIIRNPFNPNEEDITQPYKTLKDKEVPIFITTDSLLHLYHIQFDETLRQIEEREFYDKIWEISTKLLEKSIEEYNSASDGLVNEASRRNIVYFSVGLSLLKPTSEQLCKLGEWECRDPGLASAYFTSEDLKKYNFTVPNFIKADVEKELELMNKHEGFSESPLFFYREDYSQYVPRGHYTRSEKLKNYFKAFMWYGRISMLLKGSDDIPEGKTSPANPKALISTKDAKIQTTGATLITSYFASNKEIKNKWDRIYSVTAFYVGLSDDLGPYEYMKSLDNVFGNHFSASDLNDENLLKLKEELAKFAAPKIYGGTGECEKIIGPGGQFKPEDLDECLGKSKGFRLMGQRFIPDSYMFSEIVSPNVDKLQQKTVPFTACFIPDYGYMRCFPRGLDVMGLLGSKQAQKILSESGDDNYIGFENKFNNLSEEVNSFTVEDWNKNLYWSWLYSLKSLLKDYDEGYPTFMRTDAWHQKQLHSALASWAELRHDTILYAKQSYTMTMTVTSVRPPPPPEKPVVGYIEPVPEFYNRLLALSRMTKDGLEELEVLDDTAKSRLSNLINILQRLRDLSSKELENKELTQEDYDFIKNFGNELNNVIADVDDKAKKTTMIADVHTDQNTKQVLEEGIGHVDLIIVAYKVPDGRILIGAGPVMSYYEFKHPMADRLTDEKWREILGSAAPEKPEWTKTFISS